MKIRKQQTASFFVDCQRGFTDLCPDELPVPEGGSIAPELMQLWQQARIHVASGDEHPKNSLFFASEEQLIETRNFPGAKNIDLFWPAHCVLGTPGAQLIPGIPDKTSYDLYVPKGTQIDRHPYGACFYDLAEEESTGAIEFLNKCGISTVLIGGLATEYCVKSTAIQLQKAGFGVILDAAACRGLDAHDVRVAIDDMQIAGIKIIDNASALDQEPS